ncbi:MAG: thioredoxin family protein [Thiovulaceae bacterium]|nr:thioredoxin family protein [Sulfurimonadaceae bacterium]
MRKLFILVLLISSLFGEEIGELTFSHDYKKVMAQAKKKNKRVYMLITSSTCGWCRRFEKGTLSDWTVAEKLDEKYLLLHIDRDADYFPKHLKYKRVPRHYFLTSDEQVIYTFLGYWNVKDFISHVDDVDWQYNDKLKKGLLK